MRLEAGTVLADKYRIESVLGIGGMGTVYRALHLALNAPVAVKVIDRAVSEGDVALSRFMREAQAAASLRSPHVVQILDYGTDNDRPFMVMEMLEGEPLADRIERLGRLSAEETYRVIHHVAKAVSKAHEAEIVHRDLKPDNVFLVHNEGDEVAKVLDFGVAKVEATALDGAGHTRTGSLLGTPYYMSPEQAQGNKHIDARSDLWALGVIAFECMTGVRPFQSDGLGDLVLQICIRDIPVPSRFAPVPAAFDDWFAKACQREPEDRFQTARELSEALRAALGFGEAGSIPESRWAASVEMRMPAAPSSPFAADDDRYSARPTRATGAQDSVAGDATLFDDSAGPPPVSRPSHWEVLPHNAPAEAGDTQVGLSPDMARATTLSPEFDEPPIIPKRGPSIVTVALLALLVGGAGVFAMTAAGFNLDDFLPGTQKTSKRETPVGEATITSPSDATTPAATPKPSSKTPRTNKTTANQQADTSTEAAVGDEKNPDADATSLSEEADAERKAGEDPEAKDKSGTSEAGEGLDAIEQQAAEQLEKQTPAGTTNPAPSASASPKSGGSSGPSPVLPDALAPAPAPPPPAPKP